MNTSHAGIDKANEGSMNSRNAIVKNNPDIVYAVYRAPRVDGQEFHTEMLPNALFAYQNQLANISGLGESSDTHILDLAAFLRDRSIVYLRKGSSELVNEEITYMSVGVIPLLFRESGPLHTITTTRDGKGNAGLSYTNMRTGVAGRATGVDLVEEGYREWIEESPLLGVGSDGKPTLLIPQIENKDEAREIVKNALALFLRSKFKEDYGDTQRFKRVFGFEYSELPQILNDIMTDGRFQFIKFRNITGELRENLPENSLLRQSIKRVVVNGRSYDLMVHFDPNTGGYETRSVVVPEGLPDDFRLIGRGVPALFTESSVQRPYFENIGTIVGSQNPGKYAAFSLSGWNDVSASEALIQKLIKTLSLGANVRQNVKEIMQKA